MLMSVSDIGMTATGTGQDWLLPALLVLCLAVITVLAVIVVRQRRLIDRKNDYLVRYIGQYLSLKYKEFPEKGFTEKKLTQIELIEIMHLLKKMIYGCVLLLPALPAVAQDRTDTTYVFRFVPTDDMFYVPYAGNGEELERLKRCVETYWTDIDEGRIRIRVDGYCNSEGSRTMNLETAKLRSNRIKSELILKEGLEEECFVTKNHADGGDYVTVRIKAPKAPTSLSPTGDAEVTPEVEVKTDIQNNKEAKEQSQSLPSDEVGGASSEQSQSLPSGEVGGASEKSSSLSLRANLLRWATLTPDLGLEWRISPSVGVMVNGSWTSWTWNDKARRYALWEVAPEVRWYLGGQKAWYVGAMFKAGQFNYKFSGTGRQGDLLGGGITGGYQLRLNKALALDFTLGLGYLNADYEKYEVIDGVRVRRGSETKNWIGPINAGVTLVWKIGANRAQSRARSSYAEVQPDLFKLF